MEKVVKHTSTFNTSCKDCVFAQWASNVQIGCDLQRLERFDINGGREVVTDEKTGKIHSVIHRYCNGCHNNEHPVVKGLSKDDSLLEVRKKTRLQHTIVVHYRESNNIDQLIKFIDSCNNQTLSPVEIYVINNTKDKEQVRNVLINSVRAGIVWKHNHNCLGSRSPEVLLDATLNASNDTAIKGDFFSQFFLPFVLPLDFIEQLNIALNYRMERFVALEGFDTFGNGETFMTKIARSYKNAQEDFTGIFDEEPKEGEKKKKKKRVKIRGLLNKLRYVASQTQKDYQVKKIKDYVITE